MVDITLEILSTSVPVQGSNLRYKAKTWWAHVDVEEGHRVISLPVSPTKHFDEDRETTVFVEMWYHNSELFPPGAMRFLGIVKQRVDNQLRNPSWNPTMEWLDVYDPIEDIIRGRLLLKIDATISKFRFSQSHRHLSDDESSRIENSLEASSQDSLLPTPRPFAIGFSKEKQNFTSKSINDAAIQEYGFDLDKITIMKSLVEPGQPATLPSLSAHKKFWETEEEDSINLIKDTLAASKSIERDSISDFKVQHSDEPTCLLPPISRKCAAKFDVN